MHPAFFPLGLGLDIYYAVNSNERDGETTVLTSASQEKSFYPGQSEGGLSCCDTPMFGSLLFFGNFNCSKFPVNRTK